MGHNLLSNSRAFTFCVVAGLFAAIAGGAVSEPEYFVTGFATGLFAAITGGTVLWEACAYGRSTGGIVAAIARGPAIRTSSGITGIIAAVGRSDIWSSDQFHQSNTSGFFASNWRSDVWPQSCKYGTTSFVATNWHSDVWPNDQFHQPGATGIITATRRPSTIYQFHQSNTASIVATITDGNGIELLPCGFARRRLFGVARRRRLRAAGNIRMSAADDICAGIGCRQSAANTQHAYGRQLGCLAPATTTGRTEYGIPSCAIACRQPYWRRAYPIRKGREHLWPISRLVRKPSRRRLSATR